MDDGTDFCTAPWNGEMSSGQRVYVEPLEAIATNEMSVIEQVAKIFRMVIFSFFYSVRCIIYVFIEEFRL